MKDIVLKADFAQVNLSEGINRIPVYVSRIPKNIDIVDKDNLSIDVNLDDLIEKVFCKGKHLSYYQVWIFSFKATITPQKVKVKERNNTYKKCFICTG